MTTEFKASRAERSGDGDAVASVSSSSSSSASSSAAAAAPADEEDLAPISPPRAVGGRELRSPQVLPVLLTEGGAAAAASRVVAHAVDCEEEEEEEEESDGLVVVADGPSSSAPAPPAAAPSLLPATSSPLTEGRPACYLVVHNVSKKHNVGSLARAATAFGVSEVRRERASENQATELALSLSSTSTTSSFSFFLLTRFFSLSLSFSLSLTHQIQVILVGKNQYHAFGSHGSAAHVFFRHFPRLSQAKEWLRAEKGARLLGVEIDEGAVSVSAPGVFQGNTAFLMGNEVSIFREGDEMRGKRDRERESSFFSLPPSTPNRLILLLLFKKKKNNNNNKKLPNSLTSGNWPLPLPDRRLRRPRLHPAPRPGHGLPQRRLRRVDRPPPLLGVCPLRRGAEVRGEVRRRCAPRAQRAEGEGEPGRRGDRGAEGGEGREEGCWGGGGGDDGSAGALKNWREGERKRFSDSPLSFQLNERNKPNDQHLLCSEKRRNTCSLLFKTLGRDYFFPFLTRASSSSTNQYQKKKLFPSGSIIMKNLTACFFLFPLSFPVITVTAYDNYTRGVNDYIQGE